MTASSLALSTLRNHRCWTQEDMALRLSDVRTQAQRQHKGVKVLLEILFFAGAALAMLSVLYEQHNLHPALMPYIALIVLIIGYFAFTLGTGLIPPESTVRLWCDEHGALPLETDEVIRLQTLLHTYAELREIVAHWRVPVDALQRRDLDVIEEWVCERHEGQAAITARLPAFMGAVGIDTVATGKSSA